MSCSCRCPNRAVRCARGWARGGRAGGRAGGRQGEGMASVCEIAMATLSVRSGCGCEVASEHPFAAQSGFEVAQVVSWSLLWQRSSCRAFIWSTQLPSGFEVAPVGGFQMASEQPFRAHGGSDMASEQLFRAHSGFEVAQVASVREIAVFLRRQVATKPRNLPDPRDLRGPKRNY